MTRDWKHPLGCAALLALTAGCVTPLLPEQSTERESTVVAALQPNHVTIDGPLGPVVLPRACLEPVEPSVAAYSPRTSPGCALGLAMDRHLANPNDRVQPRRPGLPLSQPLANSANAYLGTGNPSSGRGAIIDTPADRDGGAAGAAAELGTE